MMSLINEYRLKLKPFNRLTLTNIMVLVCIELIYKSNILHINTHTHTHLCYAKSILHKSKLNAYIMRIKIGFDSIVSIRID